MGSGVLKTLSSNEVPHHQFLYVFSGRGYSLEPCISLLLWRLSVGTRYHRLFFITDTSVVDHGVTPLTWAWDPVALVI